MTELESREKIMKQQMLSRAIRDNIKRAVKIIIIVLLVLVNLNYFWQKYREDVYDDRNAIMNRNERLMYDALDGLRHMNEIMKDLIVGLEPSEALLDQRARFYENVDDVSYFVYDQESYRIEWWAIQTYFQNQREAIEYALDQEVLSEEALAGLADMVKANDRILEDLESITRTYIYEEVDDDRRQAVYYVYYYQGELFYLFYNAVSVYGADQSFAFVENNPIVSGVMDKSIDRQSELGDEAAMDLFLPMLDLEAGSWSEFKGMTQEGYEADGLNVRAYASDQEPSVMMIFNGAEAISYRKSMTKSMIKGRQSLSEAELVEMAQVYMNRIDIFPMQMAATRPTALQVDGDYENGGYFISYYIATQDYVDRNARINFYIHETGVLYGVEVSDKRLLDGSYDIEAIKESFITEEAAINALDDQWRRDIVGLKLEVTDRAQYEIQVSRYEQIFTFIVDAVRGELLAVQ